MLGFLTKRRAFPSQSHLRYARLSLEALESRYTPSTSISLNVAYGTGHSVTLSGQVTDPNPAGLVVTLGGVVSGQATTNSSGYFQTTLTASALGNVTATVTGSYAEQAAATANVQNTAPVIVTNFSATQGAHNIWTFSGTVNDEHAAGLIITFSGGPQSMQGLTATVGSNGTFSVTVSIMGPPGAATVSAQVVADWWGVASNTTYTYITWT